MSIGIWILGDQLCADHPALESADRARCRVLLIESCSVLAWRRYHRQKLVLVWSAMRHFAAQLRATGWTVDYREADHFSTALTSWIGAHGISELHLMEPAERPFRQAIERLHLPIPMQWHPSNAFLWSREAFAAWARPYRQLRMELFYREGRKRFRVLMDPAAEPPGSQPLGGQWNYDQANRKAPPKGLAGPQPLWFEPDAITQQVIARVEQLSAELEAAGEPGLPGRSEPFAWAVTREQALAVLEHFIATRLDGFGPYQDAMVSGQPTLWHALLSPYLNLGLLLPLEVIRRLEQAGLERGTPLASLEGVIRQILGWREYTHGLYWWFGPDYPQRNHFGAARPLPLWLEQLGGSGMACIDTVLGELKASGYAHHIQRLMVLANYGLIAGLDPQAFTGWFHRMFIDGYDWVMQTNVIGMGLFADGGLLASKPYAASGSYINRMSTYCKGCRYNPRQRSGPDACPFNALYWDFLARHAEGLARNPRMALVMKQLEKLPPEELAAIRATATAVVRGSDFSP
ncbi:MAG: cryptochrome/photolyase family protein [Cyanobacteriota bacterium]|nr:cryptochrome/photolyase family protein [Cyanobacteriota bacterium]